MEHENDVNMANLDTSVNSNESIKGSLPERSDDQRKETRRSYRMLMEETAKFDDMEPSQVNPFTDLFVEF